MVKDRMQQSQARTCRVVVTAAVCAGALYVPACCAAKCILAKAAAHTTAQLQTCGVQGRQAI